MSNPKTSRRGKKFMCLCGASLSKTRCYKTAFGDLVTSMCGFPTYTWLVLVLITLILMSLFIWVTYENLHVQNRNYFVRCNSNNDCDLTLGLQCSTEDGSCNCPAVKTKGRCDCNKGKYWNGQECSPQLDLNFTGCTYDYECDQSKKLVCLNKMCACKSPKKWNVTNEMCDYAYEGCYSDNSASPYFTSIVSNPPYFVETCIERCNKYGFSYARLYYNGGIINCECTNSNYTSPSALCNLICPGLIYARVCGSLNTRTIKPWYKAK